MIAAIARQFRSGAMVVIPPPGRLVVIRFFLTSACQLLISSAARVTADPVVGRDRIFP